MPNSRTLCVFPVIIFISHILTVGSNRIMCSQDFSHYLGKRINIQDTYCCAHSVLSTPDNIPENWFDAAKFCSQLQSHLLGSPPDDSCITQLPNYLQRDLADTLIWTDLIRLGGFFVSTEENYIFEESKSSYKWQNSNEPLFSCVALNTTSKRLITKSCNSEKLPFVCANNGFATRPIKHPACPNDWLFTHHLLHPSGCVKVFPPAPYEVSLRTCKAEGGTLLDYMDHHAIYRVLDDGYLREIEYEGYWVNLDTPNFKSSSCEATGTKFPPEDTPWKKYACSHDLAFICKKGLRDIDVDIWISPKEIPSLVSSAFSDQKLTCNVNYNSQPLSATSSQPLVKIRWYHNSIPISSAPTINIITQVLSRNRPGAFHCSAMVVGMTKTFTSNSVHVFPIDMSYFILNLALDPVYYELPDYSRENFQGALKNFYENITWTNLLEDLRRGIPGIVDASGSLENIKREYNRTETPYTDLKLLVRFTWALVNLRMENGVKGAYLAMEQLSLKLLQNPGIRAAAVLSANTCFAEGTNSTEMGTGKLYWRTSLGGQRVESEPQCFTREGTVVNRQCYADLEFGARWGPVNGECLGNITNRLYELSKVNVTSDNVINSAETMANLTSLSESLKSEDLTYIASTLRNIANTSISDPEVIRLAAVAVNNVMTANDTDLSRTQKRMNTSSRIAESFERIVSDTKINGMNLAFALDNIAVNIWQLNETEKLPIGAFATLTEVNSNVSTVFNDSDLPLENYKAGITMPFNLVLERSNGLNSSSRPRLSVVIYRTPNLFREVKMTDHLKVISPVVHASIGAEPALNLDPPVKIYFKDLKENASNSGNITCGYWNQLLDGKFGAWSTKGCTLEVNGDNYICHCDHLTNFGAILVKEDHPKHKLPLSIISFIGCGLSVFGLGMTILTFLIFRKWRKGKRHQTLVNLSVALISVLILFLAGFKSEHEIGCLVVAVLLHYFMLAAFAWMLVEAVLQYLYLVRVYNSYVPRFMIKAMSFGWGLPLVIVSIVLLIDYNLYKSENEYCWLSEDAFHFAFALPAVTLLVVNFIVFVLILYSLTCGRDNKRLRNNQDARKFAVMRLRAAVCIYFLLGLSWVFGFISIVEKQPVFQYLFVITTTLQGFFIFVFSVAQEKNAQKMWRNLLSAVRSPIQKSTASYTTDTDTVHLNTGNKR